MSSAPHLKLTASIIPTESRTTPHAGHDLDKDEATALAAFLERIGQPQIDQLARTQLEAHLMHEALVKVRAIVGAAKTYKQAAPEPTETRPYTANITIDITATSHEHSNELWMAAIELIQTSTAQGSSYIPGKGECSYKVVENGNPDAGSLQREMNEIMAKALRGELD